MKRILIILFLFFINTNVKSGFSFTGEFTIECADWRFNDCKLTMMDLKIEPLDTNNLTAVDAAFVGAALLGKQAGRQYNILYNKNRVDFLQRQRQQRLDTLKRLRSDNQKKELEQRFVSQQETAKQEQLRYEEENLNNSIQRKLQNLFD